MTAIIFGSVALLCFIVELMFLDFTFFVFALGFAISAVIAWLVPALWWIHLIIALVLSLVFLFTIKKQLVRFFSVKKSKDNFLDESGTGVVKNGMIDFKGTLWKANVSELKEGEQVKVFGIKDGQIIFEKF